VAGLDLPGIREFALPTRPISELVDRTREVVEQAAQRTTENPDQMVVVGGGAGGVELAFTFKQRIEATGGGPVAARLVHAGPRILAGYPASLERKAYRAAAQRGIQIHCGRKVAAAAANRVMLDDGESWPCDVLLWVTGAVSHPLFRDSALPVDERGFVRTRSTLQISGHDNLFAVGDCATLIDYPETPKAGVYAVRQGPYLTRNLRAKLAEQPLEEYQPQRDFLTLLNLGDGTALGAKWGFAFAGQWVMRLKDRIDRAFMQRFQISDLPSPHDS
jgi:selenide,water dikinase